MSTISVRTHFAAGHRILGLTGPGQKCRNVHGHTFHVTWTFTQEAGDTTLEFGAIKATLREMILTLFDHAFLVHRDDDFRAYLRAGKLKFYTTEHPPTTEVIVAEIALQTVKLFPRAPLVSIELCEGPDNMATWIKPTLVAVAEDVLAEVGS